VAALVAFVGVALVPGLPLSLLAMRRVRPGLSVVLVAAVGIGLGTWLLIGLPAVHHGTFDRVTLAIAGGLVAALAWIPARRHLALLRPGRPGWLAGVLALLAVPAVWLRDDPIYFAYQVADFGEYVNRGNVVARGGSFGGWFVNGFPLLLAESNLVLGVDSTTDVLPFLGLTVAAGILAVLAVAGAPRIVIAAAAVPLTFHVQAVWFSQFPASELLYAALLVVTLLLSAAALRGSDRRVAAAAGAFGFLLVVTRGNGLVYLPVVIVGLALVPVLTDRARAGVLRAHFVVLGAALWLGSLYDARFNPRYFLDAQAAPRLPRPVGAAFARLDEPLVALGFSIVVAAAIAAGAALGMVVDRMLARPRRLAGARRATVGVLALVVAAAHLLVFDPDTYLPRYDVLGPVLWASVVLGLGVWVWRARDDLDGVQRYLLGWPLLVGLTMATFQVTRMRRSATFDATWFLYWDRYFFSEAFPMLLLAGAVAAAVVVAAARASERRWATPSVLAAGGVLLVAGVVDMVPATRHATSDAMFADAYDDLAALDALMTEGIPIVFDGPPTIPDGYFWSNTSRGIVDPLRETFGRRMLNVTGASDPDPAPSSAQVRAMLRGVDATEGYVVQVRGAGEWRDLQGPRLDTEVVGDLTIQMRYLHGRRFAALTEHPWVDTELHARVLRVGTAPSTA